MTTGDTWEGVDVLIPRHVRQRRRDAMRAASLDLGALIAALPTAASSSSAPDGGGLPAFLADADAETCKAWIGQVIRALPTRADMEATHGYDD